MRLPRVFEVGILLFLGIIFSWGELICSGVYAEDCVVTINSIAHPTFYFPGSNRSGNIVGWLSSSVPSPAQNYHLQTTIRMVFAMLWPYMACCLLLPAQLRLSVSLLYHGIALTQFSQGIIYVLYFSNHPYSVSLCLILVALLFGREYITNKGSHGTFLITTASFFALLSCWVNPLSFIYLITFTITLGIIKTILPQTSDRQTLASQLKRNLEKYRNSKFSQIKGRFQNILLLFGLAFVVAVLHSIIYAKIFPEAVRSYSSTSYFKLIPSISGLLSSIKGIVIETGGAFLFLEISLAALIFSLFIITRFRNTFRDKRNQFTGLLATMLAGALLLIVMSQLKHVANNGYNPRYFVYLPMSTVLFTATLVVTALVTALDRFSKIHTNWPGRSICQSILLLTSGLAFIYGGLSQFGKPTKECSFLNNKAIHIERGAFASDHDYFAILGSYWDVWPATFYAWDRAYRQGIDRRIFPTGYRSETFLPGIITDANRQLLSKGFLRLLCVGQDTYPNEFGSKTDCEKLVQWNQNWGILPTFGKIREVSLKPDLNIVEIILELPKISNGTTLKLSEANHDFMASGWHKPQSGGTWTDGPSARIAFIFECISPPQITVKVELAHWIGNFIPNPPSLLVDVEFNGKNVSAWTFSKDENDLSRSANIPKELIRCNRPNELALQIEKPHSPDELGFNPLDKRKLGLAVKSFSFDAINTFE